MFIPYEKISKKQKNEFNKTRRTVWNMPPATKVKPSAKVYSRKGRKENYDGL